jgi:hypothetical protein
MSYFFGFESDQERSLAYIPMLVRMKLDTAGVKLTLTQWNRLPEHQRRQLFEQPCNNRLEAEVYREQLHDVVLECCGETVRLLDVPSDLPWNNVAAVPDQLTKRARLMGLEPPSLQQWRALAPAQRFALIKLTRAGHESEHYLLAMREFDLA